jgi:GrpB-like predicted nucleotidyltransferase (UPF0157 family)
MLLQDYQERWVNDFKTIEQVIKEAFVKINVSIVHVGSTSVPKLAAKPIIDIDVVYGPGVDFEEVKEELERIGYYHNGNQGIKEREVFKRSKLTKKHETLDSISHHLYVCPFHSEEFNRHLLFKNFLIENERERQQYQKIKMQIAEEAKQDGKKYAHLKEVLARDFIHSIIERAKKKG